MVGNRTENFPKTVRSGTLSCADYPDSRAWHAVRCPVHKQ